MSQSRQFIVFRCCFIIRKIEQGLHNVLVMFSLSIILVMPVSKTPDHAIVHGVLRVS